MENLRQGFLIFLEQLDPLPFFSIGVDAIEKLSEIPYSEFSRLSHEHIIILFNMLFIESSEVIITNPFFPSQFLIQIAKEHSEFFFDQGLLQKLLEILSISYNNTSASYVSQLFKVLISKKSQILAKVFLEESNANMLINHISCISISEVLKELIVAYSDDCKSLLKSILNRTYTESSQISLNCSELISVLLKTLDTRLVTKIFNQATITQLLKSVKKKPKQVLLVLCELLKLPQNLSSVHVAVRVMSENMQELCEAFPVSTEAKLIIMQAVTLGINLNLGIIQAEIAQSGFISICTVFFT